MTACKNSRCRIGKLVILAGTAVAAVMFFAWSSGFAQLIPQSFRSLEPGRLQELYRMARITPNDPMLLEEIRRLEGKELPTSAVAVQCPPPPPTPPPAPSSTISSGGGGVHEREWVGRGDRVGSGGTSWNPPDPSTFTCDCTDSDGGETYETNGTARNGAGAVKDTCHPMKNGYLTESYCSQTGQVMEHDVLCPYGCADGTCVAGTTIPCESRLKDAMSCAAIPWNGKECAWKSAEMLCVLQVDQSQASAASSPSTTNIGLASSVSRRAVSSAASKRAAKKATKKVTGKKVNKQTKKKATQRRR